MKKLLALTAMLAFLLCQAVIGAAAENLEEMVDSALELSGFNLVVDSLPQIMDAQQTWRQTTQPATAESDRVSQLLRESFDRKAARKTSREYFLKNVDPRTMKDVIAWLKSPPGQRFTAAESEEVGPGRQAAMLRYLAELQETPPPSERVALMQQLEEVTHSSELVTGILMNIFTNTLKNVAVKEGDEEAVLDELENLMPAIREQLRQQTILSSLYTYRNFTDEELEKYIAFYESASGSRYNEAGAAAIGAVLEQMFDTFTRKLTEELEKGKK
ncbi:MAG: hypothetical protein HYS23_05050 [Geobacter sp.]|nr:hypothetical protein [Geobacter sp.]